MAAKTGIIIAGIIVGAVAGVAIGLGSYTFVYANGASYLTDDARACANCHVMQSHYDGWLKSSHRSVATCNDCHTPHNFFGKYWVKSLNGYHHSLAFTTNRFHEPIQITPGNRAVTEGACRHCHEDIVQGIDVRHAGEEAISCIRCHASVGHLE